MTNTNVNKPDINRDSNDYVYAVKNIDGAYYCGGSRYDINKWSHQIRKAMLYRSEKYAAQAASSLSHHVKTKIVRVRIFEVE